MQDIRALILVSQLVGAIKVILLNTESILRLA
jgi:hypothetical protein